MHLWGDAWFQKNEKDFYNAIDEVETKLRLFRMGAYGKEKYGTYRERTVFWDGYVHTLIWPGHVAIRNRTLYWKIDPYITYPIAKYTGLLKFVRFLQKQWYNYTFQTVCKKYPNVVDELVCDLDYAEYIRPGIFGNICGKTIVDKYWEKV